MKRGFLNTPRSKRAISEAYAPRSPPDGQGVRTRAWSSQDGPNGASKKAQAPAKEGATPMDVDEPPVQDGDATGAGKLEAKLGGSTECEVQEIYADGEVVGMRMMRPTEGEMSSEDEKSTKHKRAKDPKGKGKAKAVESEDDEEDHPTMPLEPWNRNPPGWGRHPDEDFFHTVPELHGGGRKKRAVFRFWPRDPKGKPLAPNAQFKGTLSPDGYPWGATLYDIFTIHRMPEVPGFVSYMTGSAIRQAMLEMGELEAAAPEIEWAKSEGQPRVEGAADTEELIMRMDRRVNFVPGFFAPTGLKIDEEATRRANGTGDEAEGYETVTDEKIESDSGPPDPSKIPPPPKIPVTSPFHPSHYPKPWPFTPFEHELSVLLQERIPLHLLPQKLYVHDPFCLLIARKRSFDNTSWTSRPDIVRTYNLQFNPQVRKQCEEASKKAEEMEMFRSRTLIIMRYKRTKEQIKNHEPIIEVPLPPYPRRPTKIEEAHLYLSPVASVGTGHHSIVYKGEWELPREMFMKERVCPLCFEESADQEIKRLKDTGRWAKMLRAASWGPKGYTGHKPAKADLDVVNDPTNLERDGEIIERELTCVVSPGAPPSKIVERIDQTSTWDELMKNPEANKVRLFFVNGDEDRSSAQGSYVPVMRINPPFSYESQNKSCTHRESNAPTPRTAMFTVVAKLSLEYDPQLYWEAGNYQEFPDRFFQHYNGYTIIPQLKTIVPVNAIVPQFYGYYTPQTNKEGGKTSTEPPYVSPILLLEHCGEPIEPENLSEEDQEECVSMLLRFQRAGWLHESVAPRNFLVQRGKPTEFPLTRQVKPELSFRLIDFGRSSKYITAQEKLGEEQAALRMFSDLHGKMGVTLSL